MTAAPPCVPRDARSASQASVAPAPASAVEANGVRAAGAVSPAAAAFSGHLRVVAAARDDGRTFIAEQSFRAPFHVSKPYWNGSVLHLQVVNATAGVLAGDKLELDVRVRTGAAVLITTPAATRAFMMQRGVASCTQVLEVESGGWLEYAPEPLYPHADCDYRQVTQLDLAPGSEAVFVDALAPGRVGRGESWAWRHLDLALDVRVEGEPVLRERLDASGESMRRAAVFHGTPAAWIATVVVLSGRLSAGDSVWDRIRALDGRDGGWVGVTGLPRDGWIVRVLAPDGQALRDRLGEIRSILAETLPLLRGDVRKV